MFSLIEAGCTPVAIPGEYDVDPAAKPRFGSDLDAVELEQLLAERAGEVSFICVELSANARAGQPVSLGNLEQVKGIAACYGVPLILDCSRVLENAFFVSRYEDRCLGADVWAAARQLMQLADAVTLSLSKDFGTDFGGLIAVADAGHAGRLSAHLADRGQQVSLADRRTLAAALDDCDEVARLVRERMRRTEALWRRLLRVGAPVVKPAGGHCVVLDIAPASWRAADPEAAGNFLAEMFRQTGIRAAPHLDAGTGRGSGNRIRLAVPTSMSDADIEVIGDRLETMFIKLRTNRGAGRPDPAEPGSALASFAPAHADGRTWTAG